MGAGFATGQEIYTFFTRYGFPGFAGVVISTIIFCVIGSFVLRKTMLCDESSPQDITLIKYGKIGAEFIKLIFIFMQFAVFIVMISGLRTIISQTGIPNIVSSVIVTVGMFFIISSDISRIIKFNTLVTPIVILGITATCVMLLAKTYPESFEIVRTNDYRWIISALLYGIFNSVLAIPALCISGKILDSKKQAVWGGTLGGLLIGGMAFMSNTVIFNNRKVVAGSQMPIIDLASNFISSFGSIYQIIIFIAMASSAVICGRCTVDLFENKKSERTFFKKNFKALLICLLAIPLSMINFSGLIGSLYPFFGAVGIIAIVLILC